MIRLRLSGVSLHSAIARRQVLCFELGLLRLAIWSINLNVPPPWSPPSFTHTSSSGIVLLCYVSWFSLSHWSSSSVTYCGISVMVATGVCSRSYVLLFSFQNSRLLLSTRISPHIASVCCCLSFCSLANLTPDTPEEFFLHSVFCQAQSKFHPKSWPFLLRNST